MPPAHAVHALSSTAFLIVSIVKVVVVFGVVMVTVAFLTLLERWISAWIQDRLGPNRVGPRGVLQPLADGLKNIFKEETYPEAASRAYFILAPMLAITPALMTFAVIPFAAPLPTPWGVVNMVVADLPIGILYILALTSIGVYGIVMAGWSSNNKYSFMGGLRAHCLTALLGLGGVFRRWSFNSYWRTACHIKGAHFLGKRFECL